VLNELAMSTVDRIGRDGCLWNMPDVDLLHMSIVRDGMVDEITIPRVSPQTRRELVRLVKAYD
jgi:hypothetical protein